MAALDFPANPVDQQQYSINGIVYYYNASVGAWLTVLTSKLSDTSSNTQVMFNDAGVSNGSPGLVYNKVANTLTVRNIISTGNVGIGTTSPTSLNWTLTALSIHQAPLHWLLFLTLETFL
jgi:hypothetical protein